MRITSPFQRHHKTRGFTLTELAIVLGIIGLILGAIWTAAAKVYANNRVATAVQETLSITQSVRSLYGSKNSIDSANLTPAMINFGVIPSGMSAPSTNCLTGYSPCPLSPWGGEVLVASQQGYAGAPASKQRFEIYFRGPIKDCAAFLGSIISQAQNSGLVWVYFTGTAITVDSTTAITAGQSCNSAAGDIELQFTL